MKVFRGFWDYVEDFCNSKKIAHYVDSTKNLLTFVDNRIKCTSYIDHNYLYIIKKNDSSLSTSIIASMLDIESKDIDDRKAVQGIYRIQLKQR